ncbi:MAG TPA: salicylate hydroxylase [Gammaproteobacteria bacterium]|jgi:3-phenylpropionate/cinnamic acid dioxygenase small subunit|nr:salicylate hydroxylase [Gammaproteobacteria bacterium]|tara:strand:- start:664 stop:1134 length:471 start_codon:yes stop_codon:yes gene_type:complete
MTFERWIAVQKLYNDYASSLDDGPLSDWIEFFTEECLYLIQPRDNYDAGLPMAVVRCESRGMLRDRVTAVQETIMFEPRYLRHHITNIEADDASSEEFQVRANYSVIEVLNDDLPRILSAGRYLDTIVVEDGVLRFKEKRVIYDSVLVPNSLIYPL